MRQYLLDGEFFVGAAIACTLTKLALRYLDIEEDKEKHNVRFHQTFFEAVSGPVWPILKQVFNQSHCLLDSVTSSILP